MSRQDVSAAPLGSRLLGRPDEDVTIRRIRVQVLLTFSIIIANLGGIILVSVLIGAVLPGPGVFGHEFFLIDFVALPLFYMFAIVIGAIVGTVEGLRALEWANSGTEPTEDEAQRVFHMPWRLTRLQGGLWAVGAGLFALLFGLVDPALIGKVLLGTFLSAILVCTVAYLLTEFSLRPVAALALQSVQLRRRRGVAGRSLVYWAMSTAVPILVLMILAVEALVMDSVSKERLAIVILSIGSVALVAGVYVTYLTIRAITVPIDGLRSAMKRISQGDFAARVVVYDGTEIGELQGGFNVMARGLQEREEIREIFGRHVGKDVARAALAQAPELGGEDRDIAVLFVDIMGSTTIAATRPPLEVVRLLNRFFAVIVAEVDKRGGFINKFEGDGALAVFGAPSMLEDPAGSALQAARSISRRLKKEVPELQAGIGVSYGVAVAGNIGSDQRFEYTVIGDPVNEASRLCELAKTKPNKVLASEAAVTATNTANSASGEAAKWQLGEEIVLRGRTNPTRLAQPAAP
ncbi:adenylate/guanylate cyclase with integral membrane sensor [Segniliparus rotundus DSM 44985]|uniref:Adenylate/guanylate cyclase with integral membrane sensor n=1 Tax=Segniliparus rotundus (strain ATCC BAA-972 / CDC 1076 / CIP 108378 / DSM 44985 / JCM 13578) TaxID=640132 RepID=D6ZCS6_SEGRD|nr:adenylate/guanylate cyclase domain-containing protein [Segniliparus rotundus]ADG97118.1 adenylate/guanylate cyclase with integral membrane sensor [Segniliparus rotundus DSM 44985]